MYIYIYREKKREREGEREKERESEGRERLGVSRDRANRPGYRAIFNFLNTEATLLFTTDSVSAHKSRYIMYYSHVRVNPGRAQAGPSTFTWVGVTFWHSGPRFRLFTMI